MKTLLIMRHAKSDWGAEYASDFERPLNARGLRDAPMMAAFLDHNKLLPDHIVSSPAIRTRSTAEFLAREANFAGALTSDKRIYMASPAMLLEVIHELPPAVEKAMLVGHNPGMEDIIALLCGGRARMPTAAIASLRLSAEVWAEAQAGEAYLQWLLKPKLLR